jgi:DNA recombination-dependent growth factor C
VEELRQKVDALEAKQATQMDKAEVDKMFEQKLRDFLPPWLMEGIATWNATG